MVYDIILILIFALFIILGVRSGAAATLVRIGIRFAAYLAAASIGKWIAGLIYSSVIQPTIHDSVQTSVSNFSDNAFDGALNSLPTWLTGALSISGQDLSDIFREPIDGVADTATRSVEAVVQPIVIGIISFFLTIMLYSFIAFILRKLLFKPILSIFKLPVIKQVDRVLGGIAGAVEAFLLVSMIAFLLKLLVPNISTDVAFLNESTIYNSFIFYHFYNGNIFSALTSWIQ